MEIGWLAFWGQLDIVGRLTAILLLAMSIISWTIIFVRAVDYLLLKKNRHAAIEAFWQQPDYSAAVNRLSSYLGVGPYVVLAQVSEKALDVVKDTQENSMSSDISIDARITRIVRYGLARATLRIERGLAFLASVGSAAPFIGLFGTVWGILHALRGIAFSGMTQIDKIAGPISEALIMTAFGLAVAIPAVLAYNAFVRVNRVVLVDLDGFAHDLHQYFCARALKELDNNPSNEKNSEKSLTAALQKATETLSNKISKPFNKTFSRSETETSPAESKPKKEKPTLKSRSS